MNLFVVQKFQSNIVQIFLNSIKIENFMKNRFSDSFTLLNELKHKRFNSQFPSASNAAQLNFTSHPSKPTGFLCSYHPTENITNFCLNQNQSIPKPLCPRCLQQHMKNHQMNQSLNSVCRLQVCDTEISTIWQSMSQKASICQKLQNKILELYRWKGSSLKQVKQSLNSYKDQIHQVIQKTFQKFEQQLLKKWQEQNKQFQGTSKLSVEALSSLSQICKRNLSLIQTKKQIDSIVLSIPEINKKFQSLLSLEEKVTNSSSNKLSLALNRNKLNDIVNGVKSSLEVKIAKLSGFELEKSLDQIQKQIRNQIKKKQSPNDNTLTKLQRLFENKSSSKLHSIQNANNKKYVQVSSKYGRSTAPSSPRGFNKKDFQNNKQNPVSGIQNQRQRIMDRLNDTTQKLKTSLNGFHKVKKSSYA